MEHLWQMLQQEPPPLRCGRWLKEVDACQRTLLLESLALERLHHKQERLEGWLALHRGNWEEVCYISLARTLGFGQNGAAFEALAHSLPLLFLQKHADSLLLIEAFLFGQAGLLEECDSPDAYFLLLQREYHFLRNKFSLTPMDSSLWRLPWHRPSSLPFRRIALLAQLIHRGFPLFGAICEGERVEQWRQLFSITFSGYWLTHNALGVATTPNPTALSRKLVEVVLINTVAPLLHAYGAQRDNLLLQERAKGLLVGLSSEQNHIIRLFAGMGWVAQNSMESQALIELKSAYCDKSRCLSCRVFRDGILSEGRSALR